MRWLVLGVGLIVLCSLATGGASGAAAAAPEMQSVIVTLREQATLARGKGSTRAARLAKVITTLQSKANATQTGIRAVLEAGRRRGAVREFTSFWVFNGLEVTATPELVAQLARRPEVLKITPNPAIQGPTEEAAASTPEANISLVGAPDLWALGFTGSGIVVASMDSGVDASHPDLATQWRGGANSWFDPNGEHPTTPTDASGHGTQVMGVMVGRDAGGTAVGVAPDAQWIAVKIFADSGSSTIARVHEGFQWLLDPDGNLATPDAPHVVNNSWTFGSPGCNLEFQLDLQALRAAEIVPVFAAGNYGPQGSTSRSPANNPEALAVGATTKTDGIWSGSSRGPASCPDTDTTYPEVVAPGASIRSTAFGGYMTSSGTSLSAPHVTGALALLLDSHADATAAELETALESAGVDLGSTGPDTTYGHGRLDILAAFNWLGTAPPDFALAASPSSASTAQGGGVSYTAEVTPQGGFSGDVALSATGLPAGATASFDPAVVMGGGGSSILTVSTSPSTPVGSYLLTITATSGSLSQSALVTLIVDPPPDFTISASPSSASAAQGGGVSYTISVGSLNGFTAPVALSVNGLPADAGASFNPSVIVGGAGSSQLAVSTAGTTPSGSYPLTITGSSGWLHTTTVVLVVSPAQLTAFPASTTVLTGTYGSGSAPGLATDDSAYYVVNSTTKAQRTSAWYATMTAVPNSLTSLLVTYKGKNSRTCTQTVAIWSWASSSWVILDSRNVGTSELLIANLVPGGALADYVSGSSGSGELRVLIRCQTSGGAFTSSGNLARIVFSRP